LIRACALALLVPLLLAAGGCKRDGMDYLPLGEQRLWKYRIDRTIKGEQRHQKIIIAGLPPATVDGAPYYPLRRLDDRIELYEKTAGWIFRVDRSSGNRARILPQNPYPGMEWQGESRILFLEVTGAFSATFEERIQTSIPLDYVVESLDDEVEVPAGRFRDCLRVKGRGSMFGGGTLKTFMGIRFIKVEQTDWYARGVGLVKRVRNEYTTPAEWSNQYTEELESVR